MDKCFNCGGEVSERSNFCPWCGIQLRELPPEIAAMNLTEEERLKPMEVNTYISIVTKKK